MVKYSDAASQPQRAVESKLYARDEIYSNFIVVAKRKFCTKTYDPICGQFASKSILILMSHWKTK